LSHLETLDGQGPLLLQPCAITWVLHYQGPSSQSCRLEFFFVRKALPICLRKEEKTHSTSLRIATCCARHARCFEQQAADLRPDVPSTCKQLCSAVVVQGVQKNPCACTQHSGSKMLTSIKLASTPPSACRCDPFRANRAGQPTGSTLLASSPHRGPARLGAWVGMREARCFCIPHTEFERAHCTCLVRQDTVPIRRKAQSAAPFLACHCH